MPRQENNDLSEISTILVTIYLWLINYNEFLLSMQKIWKYNFSFVTEIKYLLLEPK